MMKSFLSVALTFFFFILTSIPLASQDMTIWRIGTGSAGGTFFPLGGVLANAISNPPGSRPCNEGGNCGVPGLIAIAQSTNASAYNASAVQSGELDAGFTGAATLHYAYHGIKTFEGDPNPDLRIITTLYPQEMHLVLPKGEQLNGFQDLIGKRVGIGQSGSGTQIVVELILADYGVTRDNIDEVEYNNSVSAKQLAEGKLDAYFYSAGTPIVAMLELDSTTGMELYSFTEEEVNQAVETVSYYVPSTISAGTYPNVNYDVKTIAVNAIFITNANQPEDLIYSITKALWSETARNLLDNSHPKGKLITSDTALQGIEGVGVPLHPGAERFYREIGLLN